MWFAVVWYAEGDALELAMAWGEPAKADLVDALTARGFTVLSKHVVTVTEAEAFAANLSDPARRGAL